MKSFNVVTLIVCGCLLALQLALFAGVCWAVHLADVRCQQSEEQVQQEHKRIVEQVQQEHRRIVEQVQEELKKTEEAVVRINREFLGTVKELNQKLLRDVDKSLSRR